MPKWICWSPVPRRFVLISLYLMNFFYSSLIKNASGMLIKSNLYNVSQRLQLKNLILKELVTTTLSGVKQPY